MRLARIWLTLSVNVRMSFMDDIDSIAKLPSIEVEVAYALPDKQELITLSVKKGTTAQAAVLASGLTSKYPRHKY